MITWFIFALGLIGGVFYVLLMPTQVQPDLMASYHSALIRPLVAQHDAAVRLVQNNFSQIVQQMQASTNEYDLTAESKRLFTTYPSDTAQVGLIRSDYLKRQIAPPLQENIATYNIGNASIIGQKDKILSVVGCVAKGADYVSLECSNSNLYVLTYVPELSGDKSTLDQEKWRKEMAKVLGNKGGCGTLDCTAGIVNCKIVGGAGPEITLPVPLARFLKDDAQIDLGTTSNRLLDGAFVCLTPLQNRS